MRRYDLDWLRVLVFGLLILYHVGMFFVPWSFHLKNNELYPDLQIPMRFLNGWRLPMLFMISGMGTAFALGTRSGSAFLKERFVRLMIPLLFGMLVVVPPQVYLEKVSTGVVSGSYFEFWPQHALEGGAYPEGNISWHHLWFLPYLFLYSIVLLPIFLFMNRHEDNILVRWVRTFSSSRFGLYLLLIPLFMWEVLLEPYFPTTHALIGDWYCFMNGMTFFFYGFLLVRSGDSFRDNTREYRLQNMMIAISAFVGRIIIEQLYGGILVADLARLLLKLFFSWAMILSLFGYASIYLNTNSRVLRYANEAVYPFYILHQSVMMVGCYWMMNLNGSFGVKFPLLVLMTFVGTWIIYECCIRRWRFVRPLFGMKNKAVDNNIVDNQNRS